MITRQDEIARFIDDKFPDYSHSSKCDMVNAINKWREHEDEVLNNLMEEQK